MDSIKARIRGDDVDSSIEFSVEEVIAHHPGKKWSDMNEAEQRAAMKDYALMLYSRQGGAIGNFQVSIEGGTFSKVEDRDI